MDISRRQLLTFGAAGLVLAGCSSAQSSTVQGSSDAPVVLRAVTGQNGTDAQMMGVHRVKEVLEERSEGRLIIDYLGGPEIIPAFKQGEAIQSGMVDLAWTFSSYYAHLVPEALALTYSTRSYQDELQGGSISYLNGTHEESAGIRLMGRGLPAKFTLYVADANFESIADFRGKTFRGTATYQPMLKALGAETLALPGGEIYTALDRGMVDGFAWGEIGVSTLGVERLVGAQVFPTFFNNDQVIIGNTAKWNSMSASDQELLNSVIIDVFDDLRDDVQDHRDREREILLDNDVKITELADAEEFLDIGVSSSWDWLATRVEDIDRLAYYFKD